MDLYDKVYNKIAEDQELFKHIKNEDIVILDIKGIIKDAMEYGNDFNKIIECVSEHLDFMFNEIICEKVYEYLKK